MLPSFDMVAYNEAGGDNPPPHWQFQYWTTTRGRKMHISQMAVPHLKNAKKVVEKELDEINLIVKSVPSLYWSFLVHYHIGLRERWIKAFEIELRERGVLDG